MIAINGAKEKNADVLLAPTKRSAYKNKIKATPYETAPTPSSMNVAPSDENLSPTISANPKVIIPFTKPIKEMICEGDLCDTFLRKLFAKPKHIGETRHKIEPNEKFKSEKSFKDTMTHAANIKAIAIQRYFEILSLKMKKATNAVEIISKEPSKEALLAEMYLKPNKSEMAAPE